MKVSELVNKFCIIWGASGQCKVLHDILQTEECELLHVFDNDESVHSPLENVPISYGEIGFVSFVHSLTASGLSPTEVDCITAIGGHDGDSRQKLTHYMSQFGFRARSVMHRTAIVSDSADIGESCQILAGAIVGASTRIGSFTIVNSGACVEHDCEIGEGSHIAPMATLAGEVTIGRNVFVGSNATILPRVTIGDGAVIGAGAVVTKSFNERTIAVGNPARQIEVAPKS